MDPDFWHERWRRGETGFHLPAVHDLLIAHGAAVGIRPGARVFLPLCGKTRDIGWLLAQGIRVAGVELSAIAIRDLFAGLGVTPAVSVAGDLVHHRAAGLDIFCGDIFALDADRLGPVDAVYDRAALIALPPALRDRYAPHLMALTGRAPQLLITIDYPRGAIAGPPFLVDEAEIRRRYGGAFAVSYLGPSAVGGSVRGHPARDLAWALRRGGATAGQPLG